MAFLSQLSQIKTCHLHQSSSYYCIIIMTWSRDLVTWHDTQPHPSNSKVMNLAHPKTPSPSDLRLIYDLRSIYGLCLRKNLLLMSPCQRFAIEKNRPCALTPKDLDEQSFFIDNGGKAGRGHPRFINNRADKGYPRSINGSAGRYHPCTTIKEAIVGGRAGRSYPRSINGSAGRCHPRITIESH